MDLNIKKLDLQPENKGFKSIIRTQHFKRSMIAILIGSVAGFGFFYFTDGRSMDTLLFGDVLKSILIGGFFGFFITNSPCARNRC